MADTTYAGYSEYLEGEKKIAESTKTTAIDAANKKKKSTYEEAGALRDSQIVDAQAAYAQNKATYGAKAEAMLSMGLTGRGYSDYIDSQAYATQRADVQAANNSYAEATRIADQTATDEINKATATYNERISQLNEAGASYAEEQKRIISQNYATVREKAMNGELSDADVYSYANEFGFDESQIEELETINSNKRAEWGKSINTGESTFRDYDGQLMSKAAAQQILDEYLSNPWMQSDENKDIARQLQETFNKIYKVDVKGGNISATEETIASGDTFYVQFKSDSPLAVKSTGICNDEKVIAAASDVTDELMFKHNGNIYIKKNGNVYGLSAASGYDADWGTINSVFDGDNSHYNEQTNNEQTNSVTDANKPADAYYHPRARTQTNRR